MLFIINEKVSLHLEEKLRFSLHLMNTVKWKNKKIFIDYV
jgi:hypothetical protein